MYDVCSCHHELEYKPMQASTMQARPDEALLFAALNKLYCSVWY